MSRASVGVAVSPEVVQLSIRAPHIDQDPPSGQSQSDRDEIKFRYAAGVTNSSFFISQNIRFCTKITCQLRLYSVLGVTKPGVN